MFPCALSKSLRSELCPESLYPDIASLAKKLDEKPHRLIDFLHAALQSKNWSRKYDLEKIHIVIRISSNLASGRLAFEESITRCTHIFKYYVGISGMLTLSDFIVCTSDDKKVFLSKIVLMRESPVLKARFCESPDLALESLSDFAKYLVSGEELAIFYHLLFSDDYAEFINLDSSTFQRILFQCSEWQCRHLDELQRIFTKRIVDFFTATGELALAKCKRLSLLEEAARAYLDNVKFLVHNSEKKHGDNYLLHQPVLDSDFVKDIFYPQELLNMSARLVSSGYQGDLRIRLDLICMSFQNESRLMVGFVPQPLVVNMQPIQKWRREVREEKLDVSKVKIVGSDGSNKMPDISLVGLLIYTSNVDRLELLNYETISDLFLERLSLKDNLLSLAIISYEGSLDELLPLIPINLPRLTDVEINVGFVKEEALTDLLEKGGVAGLHLINCTLEPACELANFSNLKRLTLTSIETNYATVQNILNQCTNLEFLTINHVVPYTFVLPKTITKLAIGSSLISRYVVGDRISLFPDSLPCLKELIILGEPDSHLKNAILTYLKKGSFKIRFEK